MGLLDKLFGKYNRKPEINTKNNNRKKQIENDFNEALKITPITPENNPDMLEYDIKNWLEKFFDNPYEYSSPSAKSYACLISNTNNIVDGHDVYTNRKNEEFLNQYIEHFNLSSLPMNYVRDSQKSSTGTKAFNFIIPDNSLEIDTKFRLYANCEYKDTSRMVYEFLKHCTSNDIFHLKYVSSECTKNRNEKIVVYTDTEKHLNSIFAKFQRIQEQHPELLKKENNIPFMKNFIPGIGYGNQPENDFIDLKDNSNPEIAKSFNSYISEILLESLTDTTNRICTIDPEISKYVIDNSLDKNIYKYMTDKYHKSFMENMVDKVLLLSEKNKLDIKRTHNQNLQRYNNKKDLEYDKALMDKYNNR